MAPRVLLVGLGSIGSRHLRLIRQHFSFEVTALRSHRGKDSGASGIPELTSWEEIDKQSFDVALITNPTNLHINSAIRCAERGMHLFIEKPIDCQLAGLDVLESLVRQHALTAYVAYPLRFHPVVRALKKRLSAGTPLHASMVCSSFLPHWRPNQDYRQSYSCFRHRGGGVLLDMSHELDMAEYLFGPVKELRGTLGRQSGLTTDSEDCADMVAVHEHNVTNIYLSYFGVSARRYIEVETSTGLVRADLRTPSILSASSRELDTESFSVDADSMYLDQLRYFFANLGRADIDNCLAQARALFETIIAFREDQGYGSVNHRVRTGRVTGGQGQEYPAPS